MWFHKSRSVSKREKKCTIGFFHFGGKRRLRGITYVDLPNEETEININELFENKSIDTNEAFNYKLSGFTINIFTLPLINTKDNNSIYIGIKDNNIIEDILCITKDNIIKNYLLLPYLKVNKDNLEEGKYVNKHTQMSYHLGLFELQVQDEILTSAILIDTISIKDNITLDEFLNLNNIFNLLFYPQEYIYSVVGLSGVTYFLTHKLTNSIYLFNFSDITNPKIGNIFGDKYNVNEIGNNGWKLSYFSNNTGRWFFQLRLDDSEYLVKDNCNGKYEKINRLKENNFYLNKGMLLYDKQDNPYSHYENHYFGGELEEGSTDIMLLDIVEDSDLKKLPFSKTRNRYIRFQFTPFNNLNLVYYYNNKDLPYLYKYSIIPDSKGLINIYKLNPNNINDKYKIHDHYKNTYHHYLYYLSHFNRVPYIQVWGDKSTNKVYGCILNMRGKWSVFDNEIIEEK